MTDALGFRLKAAVLAPSTNTIVEPDYYFMAPRGVTFHMGRIYIENPVIDDDSGFENLLEQVRASMERAIKDVMTCEPDAIIMGMSAETFWGGKEGNKKFEENIEKLTGLKVYSGAAACHNALQLHSAKKIGVVTPYQRVGDEQVVNFFNDWGYEVVNIKGLKCPTAVSIAHVTEDELREAIYEVNEEDVDAIVQVGTNLSMVKLADEAERWLNKPVIPINAATLWHALRKEGIKDQFDGFTSLFNKF
ncbi:maleate isomerase [Evansella vedderi]|uniref:Maleate isomerase n=1 Tax=Evansella vedderi TaxID=38282 RepID=A0ABT9ZYJ2_9BACI|nr:hypothetical protein [Evansella vedderi]MDQ0256297.1 maleate isomerase [Evansella vedderi]